MSTRIHQNNVHEKLPQKRNSTGQKCPREFVKSFHENSPILSTRICFLCPLEFFHPTFKGVSSLWVHSRYRKVVRRRLLVTLLWKVQCFSTAFALLSNHKNIWKDITMKEMTSSNQTSFSLNLKSFFKRAFGAAIDKINNKNFVQCLVQENLLLVILSNLTALYAWQCSDAFHLLSRGFHLYLSELAFINQFYSIMTRLVQLSLANDKFRNHCNVEGLIDFVGSCGDVEWLYLKL